MTTEINPFTDIEYEAPQVDPSKDSYQSAKTFQVGYGSSVLRVNRQGIWLGRATFDEAAAAPTFAVSMDGVMYLQQIQASNITIFGDTTLADWRNSTDKTTIEGGNIYTNTITADKMNVDELSAISADLGTITAGTFLTAGASQRIKIEDDDILWQRLVASVWTDCGVLRGASISYQEYFAGGISALNGNGIEHFNSGGIAFYSDVFSSDQIWADTKIHSPEIWGGKVYRRGGSGGTSKVELHGFTGGDGVIDVSLPSSGANFGYAVISWDPSSTVDFNGENATNIGDCHADQFHGAGNAGVTNSVTFLDTDLNMVTLSVDGGIVTTLS